MNKTEYLRLLMNEDYMQICYKYYIHKDKKNLTLDFSDFYKYFKIWVTLKADQQSIIKNITNYYDTLFKVTKVFDKEGELLAYY